MLFKQLNLNHFMNSSEAPSQDNPELKRREQQYIVHTE